MVQTDFQPRRQYLDELFCSIGIIEDRDQVKILSEVLGVSVSFARKIFAGKRDLSGLKVNEHRNKYQILAELFKIDTNAFITLDAEYRKARETGCSFYFNSWISYMYKDILDASGIATGKLEPIGYIKLHA